MCGILGWLSPATSAYRDLFEEALDLLAHRGPDDRGIVQLPEALFGHRRLSIIDLSVKGHQPMVDDKTKSVLLFNGEIYNYKELRIELEKLGHSFFGDSDSEVLLCALIEWGEACVPKLNGMWAFAFWHGREKRLWLARDRFGVKPLYYRTGKDGFAFASEPKALLHLFPAHRRVCQQALFAFLTQNALYQNDRSFYEGISVFPPAHYGVIDGQGCLRLHRYWDYPAESDKTVTAQDAAAEFEHLFNQSVDVRLRSDVPVGLTLSGGLDSTAILASAKAHSGRSLVCFTSDYETQTISEISWARKASQAAKTPLIPVLARAESWQESMKTIAWHMDGPGYSPAVYPLWCLMKTARQHGIPVLLEGQGADESLAGYPQYAALALWSDSKKETGNGMLGMLRHLHMMGSAFSFKLALAWIMRERLGGIVDWHRKRVGAQSLFRKDIYAEFNPYPKEKMVHPTDTVYERLRMDHAKMILPGLLHYGDAVSMAHSIEARHPFLDYRLVEWIFRLPSEMKFMNNETKWVLRHYLRQNGQKDIGDRRVKKGYPTPVREWLNHESEHYLETFLLPSSGLLREWCEPKALKKLIRANQKGRLSADHHLYKLVSTQFWLSNCIESGICP